MSDLYNEVRPTLLKQIIGQPTAVEQIKGMLSNGGLEHATGLIGPSGVGKTTAAFILKHKMQCGDRDFRNINAADDRGILMVRGISEEMKMAPWNGKCRMYLIDEAHKLTNDAQNALLNALEFTPKHVYFMLASSEPEKIIKAIQTRLTMIKFDLLSEDDIKRVVLDALVRKYGKEGERKINHEELEAIGEVAEGSARKALVVAGQVLSVKNPKERMNVIFKFDTKKQAMDLFKALMDKNTKWSTIQEIVNRIDDDPERLRIGLRAIVAGSAFKWKNLNPYQLGRFNLILSAFSDRFYDGKGSLAQALLDCFTSK